MVLIHVTISLMLMKGEYDDQLKWLFRGKFITELLSQDGDKRRSKTVNFNNAPDASRNRVMDGEQAQESRGFRKFIPYTELKPMYLQNDCLKFCIKKVD